MIKKINEASRKTNAKVHSVTYKVMFEGFSGWAKYDDLEKLITKQTDDAEGYNSGKYSFYHPIKRIIKVTEDDLTEQELDEIRSQIPVVIK